MIAYSKGRIKQASLLFLVFVFLFTACRKGDSNTIGADFIGNRNGFNVLLTDTTSLILFSVKHDSIPTTKLTYYMLGDMNDPIFGKTKSNIYSQFSVPVNGWSFGGAIIDSVVLRLKFVSTSSYYGNIFTPQDIGVYELKEPLINIADSGYFSNRDYKISDPGSHILPAPIGFYSGTFNLTDSFYETVGGVKFTIEPHLRIKLSSAFTDKLQRASSGGAFLTDVAFQNYINGLAILAQTPESRRNPGQGAIAYLNLRSAVSAVVVYYGGTNKIEFPIAPTDVITNQYSHTTNLVLQPYLSKTHYDECYLQSNAGIKTRILMPNILGMAKNHDIAVIGAEMIFTVQDGKDDGVYTIPNNIWLQGSDSIGRNSFLEDFFEAYPLNYYGGTYDQSTRQYKFNIIRHIQKILTTYRQTGKDINYGMNLIIPADDYLNGIGAGRVVLNTNTIAKKVKLNLSYSVIK